MAEPRTRAEASELATLYAGSAYTSLWVDATGRPTRNVRDALDLLAAVAADGLDPGAYRTEHLRGLAVRLERDQPGRPLDIAGFDIEMSTAMLRYFRHLHVGRIDPRTIGFRLVTPAEPHDFAVLLRSALGTGRLRETASELAPPLAQYRVLRSMLARYRELAAGVQPELPAPPMGVVRPGDRYTGLGELHRRLVALGDLATDTPPPAADAPYDGTLMGGVKRFQTRHAAGGPTASSERPHWRHSTFH